MATNNYPLTGFHFTVKWSDDDENVSFSEVSGLSVSTTPIEYREGANKEYTTFKMPGLKKYDNVTLKRGSMATDNGFYEWFNTIANNTVERRDITISLLNETHEPVVTWSLKNAFPIKYDGGSLNASDGQVLVESVELAYESFTVTRG
ncbi:MAG: phage tail protein [Paludibacteraceae bacterium]|nr:phage tail protein [Paludibacteraceae bacterium]MBR5373640.1 phage tail protein [Paludibacteraceae bacterium]